MTFDKLFIAWDLWVMVFNGTFNNISVISWQYLSPLRLRVIYLHIQLYTKKFDSDFDILVVVSRYSDFLHQ